MDDSKTAAIFATLDLVCPPIPNSIAVKLTDDPEAERVIRTSDFYMICGRAQAAFGDFEQDLKRRRLTFSIEVLGGQKDFGWIQMDRLQHIAKADADLRIRIFFSDRVIRFVSVDQHGAESLFAGFTPDEVLMRRGRKDPVVGGFKNHLSLATYDLLYVGIAKVGDSYDRLFAKGHKARMEILANEPQRYPGARVSDETYLFLFKVEPLMLKSFGIDAEIEAEDVILTYDNKRLVADAEKAFVNLLKPEYNSQLYPNYPKGKDGLYDTGLDAYTFSISEGMAFRTPIGNIKGGRERELTISNEADFILVKGDHVRFHVAGHDYDVS